MNEIDDLILEVEKHSCLWNNLDINYQNKAQRDLAWDEVCRSLFLDWDSYDREDKKTIYDIKKKQWNNVRDGYRKYLYRVKSTGYTKKYTYGDNLHFLKPIILARNREESVIPDSPEFLRVEYLDNGDESPAEEINEEEDNIRQKTLARSKTRTQSKHKSNIGQNERTNFSYKQIMSKVPRRPKTEVSYQDEDSQFLLSFRSDLKVMSKSQKLQFKLGMIQLIQSVTENSPNT